MSLFTKYDQQTVLLGLIIIALCTLISLSPLVPIFALVGYISAALYLLVGIVLSLRSPNELAMPPLQFAGRILHAQIFYALVVILSAAVVFLCIQMFLKLLGVANATRWAILIAASFALSTPMVLAGYSRFLLSHTAGWDRLRFFIKEPKNLIALPAAIVVVSAICALALSSIIDNTIPWLQNDLVRWLGWILIWGGVGFLFARSDFHVRNAALKEFGTNTSSKPIGPSKILFVGADAGDWQIIMPLVKTGHMPNLSNLVDSGTYGYLDTFGRMHSPVLWTTMATAASVDLHGITDFFKHDPRKSEKRRLFEIQDRQVPAIWDMLNQMDRSVGVINWLLAYAPERIDGYMISRMRDPAVYPENYKKLLSQALSQLEGSDSVLDMTDITTDMGEFRLVKSPEEAIKDLKRIGTVAPEFMRKVPVDLTMVYEDTTDGIQHTTWQYREPNRFDSEDWNYDVADIPRYGDAIDEAWEEFDQVLGLLLKELDPNGLVMVVSDHGFMPRETPSVYLDMNALLGDLGYLEFDDEGNVDFNRTTVYWSTREITNTFTDLSFNHDQNSDSGGSWESTLESEVQRVTADLQGLKINGRKPLFNYITSMKFNGTSSIRIGLSDETMMIGRDRVIQVDRQSQELDNYLKVVPDGSGRHDPFGMFVFSGPGIERRKVVASGAVHTVLNDLLGHVRGLSRHPILEIAFHLLDRFGIINPYTTNDVAPTLLYLADCPIPEYSVGTVMDRTLSKELKRTRAIKFVKAYQYEQDETGSELTEDSEQVVIERLRALGYID